MTKIYIIVSAPVTADVLHKLASGEALTDPELCGVAKHFKELDELLLPLGPTWALAQQAAVRVRVQVESYLRNRAIFEQPDGSYGFQ
jgi:hypothetical protein